jgi:hypothetical protein
MYSENDYLLRYYGCLRETRFAIWHSLISVGNNWSLRVCPHPRTPLRRQLAVAYGTFALQPERGEPFVSLWSSKRGGHFLDLCL